MPDPFDLFAPRSTTRAGRLLLLGECADALIAGELPSPEARLYLAALLDGWLRHGGAFETYAQIGPPRGSHRTHARLYAALIGDEEGQIRDCDLVSTLTTPNQEQQK